MTISINWTHYPHLLDLILDFAPGESIITL